MPDSFSILVIGCNVLSRTFEDGAELCEFKELSELDEFGEFPATIKTLTHYLLPHWLDKVGFVQ